MDGKTTVKYLQNYLKEKDYAPDRAHDYFLKLVEEVGELSNAVYHGKLKADTGVLKGTIDEEIWDVIYYAIALANCYDIDLEAVIKEKEELNRIKYGHTVVFEEDR